MGFWMEYNDLMALTKFKNKSQNLNLDSLKKHNSLKVIYVKLNQNILWSSNYAVTIITYGFKSSHQPC